MRESAERLICGATWRPSGLPYNRTDLTLSISAEPHPTYRYSLSYVPSRTPYARRILPIPASNINQEIADLDLTYFSIKLQRSKRRTESFLQSPCNTSHGSDAYTPTSQPLDFDRTTTPSPSARILINRGPSHAAKTAINAFPLYPTGHRVLQGQIASVDPALCVRRHLSCQPGPHEHSRELQFKHEPLSPRRHRPDTPLSPIRNPSPDHTPPDARRNVSPHTDPPHRGNKPPL